MLRINSSLGRGRSVQNLFSAINIPFSFNYNAQILIELPDDKLNLKDKYTPEYQVETDFSIKALLRLYQRSIKVPTRI